jgi:hypothetical protein
MSRFYKLFALSLLVVGLSVGVTFAASNAVDDDEITAESGVAPDGVITLTRTANTRNSVFSYGCSAPLATRICVQVADLGVPGDVWRGTISRTNGSDPDSTSNQTAGGVVLAPGVLSPQRCTVSTTAIIHAGPGNGIPAGVPASFAIRLSTIPAFAPLTCFEFIDQPF